MMLLVCGHLTSAHAQAISDPNQITGVIGWNNPPGPVLTYLNSVTPPHGLAAGSIYANEVGGGSLNAVANVPDDASHISAPYSMTVQAGVAPGIQYDVLPIMNLENGSGYYFAGATSAGVELEPAMDVVLNFSECAGLIEVQFCDANNNPVPVPSFTMVAYLQPSGALQAASGAGGPGNTRMAVRGGNTFKVDVSLPPAVFGTDPFLDLFSFPGFIASYTVTVGCDEIVVIKVIAPPIPPAPGGAGGGADLGRIIGIADVLGKSEHWFNDSRTILNGFGGPSGNFRYANIEPLSQPGYLPCVVASPQVGTPSCNSAGPFSLMNLLPSNFSTPPADYTVVAAFYFDLNRRFELFVSPYLYGVTVPSISSGGVVDLGTTFVINPGFVAGDIFLCGPHETVAGTSPLRHIYRTSDDHDSNGDGIAELDADMNLGSKLIANGLSVLGAGATHSAFGGVARVLFEGDFVPAGPDKDHFVGDYIMTLGGLDAGSTHWDQSLLNLVFSNVGTPTDPDNYIDSQLGIYNAHYSDVEIVPTQTIRGDHRYGMSKVIITFHSNSGKLVVPRVDATGTFNGSNFEGQAAQYGAVSGGFGTPIDLASAAADGEVVLCLPEGTYTFNPTVFSVNPDGISTTYNTLPAINNVKIGGCETIVLTSDLVLNTDPIPECVPQSELTISGSVYSGVEVASITYTLNGNAVEVCHNCGLSPSFSFNLILAPCDNTLEIVATDVNGRVSSRSKSIHSDANAPALSNCADRTVEVSPGETGAVVDFSVTAIDLCDGAIVPTCTPPSGSIFPVGQTTVTCQAVDTCGNVGTCSFIVTVNDVDRMPPTIQCPTPIVMPTDPGKCSAVATFFVTANDNRPGVAVVCSPPSGSTFPKGTTTIICTATDTAGNAAHCSFTVTVEDHEAPKVGCEATTCRIPEDEDDSRCRKGADGSYCLFPSSDRNSSQNVRLYVRDSAEGGSAKGFQAGPYPPGTKVRFVQTSRPAQVKQRAGDAIFEISTRGEPVLVIMDAAGKTTLHVCHVYGASNSGSDNDHESSGRNSKRDGDHNDDSHEDGGRVSGGIYRLLASDNCDPAGGLLIYIKDSKQGPCGGTFQAGPFVTGTKVRFTKSTGSARVKRLAGGDVLWEVATCGDPVLVVIDSSGNRTCHKCVVSHDQFEHEEDHEGDHGDPGGHGGRKDRDNDNH